MTEEVFRIIVAVGVGLACIMFVVQAFVMLGLLKIVKKVEQRVEGITKAAEPIIADVNVVLKKVGPVLEDVSPVVAKVGPLMDKAAVIFEKTGPVIERVEASIVEVKKLLATANRIVEDSRPRISEVTEEVASISHTGREQVDKWSDFLDDANQRARNRMEQIDHKVENTVDTVGNASETLKRTVTRPVREVNGLAAGISAAVATLVGKPRKYSVDSATQDEEMFI
jgi:uncharacterized protein YoxC